MATAAIAAVEPAAIAPASMQSLVRHISLVEIPSPRPGMTWKRKVVREKQASDL